MMADCQSEIFSAEFQATRWKIHLGGPVQDGAVGIDVPSSDGEVYAYISGRIHQSVLEADPLLLCEVIRLGADLNLRDSNGMTALQAAMNILTMPAFQSSNQLKRIRFIARTLIEQHADIETTPTISALHSACQAREWEFIELLLHHGARATAPGPVDLLTSASDKTRFRNLDKSPKTRPPRPCPCWSGKLLADCHATEKLYPDTFHCCCGSRKLYGKCCKKRNISFFEKWDGGKRHIEQETGWFMDRAMTAEGVTQEFMEAFYISMPRKFLPSKTVGVEEARLFLNESKLGYCRKG